jgi:S-DNA-T family DNA segregation ATPase FtsK/SpoIIIE
MGAFCAYYLLYYFGPGVFVILLCGIWFLIAQLANKPVDQPGLRAVGMALLTIAISGTFFGIWHNKIYAFPMGSGGVVGVAAVSFLKSHFALLGTFILIASIWVVGTILLADSLVLTVLNSFGAALIKIAGVVAPTWAAAREHSESISRIWKNLSIRQKFEAAKLKMPPTLGRNSGVRQTETVTAAKIAAEPKTQIVGLSEQSQTDNKLKVSPYKPEQVQSSVSGKEEIPSQEGFDDYTLPPVELLDDPEFCFSEIQVKVVKSKAAALERLLGEFNINARVVATDTGPVVTMFELELAPGVKVSQISSLSNDIARALSAGAVRVVAPLPGKHTIGIEVPNSEKERVRIKDLINLAGDRPGRMNLPLFLGKDSSGDALVSDLAKMPHLLIAGTTGSGKSVCINAIITGILLTKRPDEVKLILIDPKMVEMTAFNTIPHLMCPIVTETSRAVKILEWATVKMDERYCLLAEARVKNINEFNQLTYQEIMDRFQPGSPEEEAKVPKRLPYIVIVIDELADLMMTAPKEIEAYIVRLAQKSRAVGIHIVLATQRPQATVVTGLIKSNMPTRIGFRVAARMDSRIILDQNGAEALLGQGDMLFLKPGTSDLIRAQGTYVDEDEVKRIVRHLKEVAEPQFHPELTQLNQFDTELMEKDDLFDEAVRIVLETQRGSVSLLQRRLSVGYARASRMIEMMAAAHILGEYKGSQAREVVMTLEEYERLKEQTDRESSQAEGSSERDEPEFIREGQRAHAALDEEQ